MRKIWHLIFCIFLFSCGEADNSIYLKEIYESKDFKLSDLQHKDTIKQFIENINDCDSIKKITMSFNITHEHRKSLNNLYLNIYVENQKIYSNYFSKNIKSIPFDFCFQKNKQIYMWFSAYDTIHKIYYSWGQKNSVTVKLEYEIKLLQEEDNNNDNYLIEN